MSFWLQDLAGLALATLLAPILLYLPGAGILRLCTRAGLNAGTYWQRVGWAMLLGLAVLPVLDTLAIRVGGMPAMLLVNSVLTCWGLPLLKARIAGELQARCATIALLWWGICAWSFVDVDIDGRLNQSLLIFDLVKHAAVVEQIVREGVPFSDPFFARDGVAGYYHYFYAWGAAIRWMGGDAINARMAYAGTVYWTGFGLVALLWRVAFDASFIRPGRDRRVLLLSILLCFVAGADLFFMLLRYLAVHQVEPQLDSWNTEVRMFATSVLGVPHHVAAMIAAWTGMLLVARAGGGDRFQCICLGMFAGACFATMFGDSVWIAVTIAPMLAIWTLLRLYHRDFTLVAAGFTALFLSLPQLRDIAQGRAAEAFPIIFGVRRFTFIFPDDTWEAQLQNFLLLPINYSLEFGIFALGAYLYWRKRKRKDENGVEVRNLLVWSSIVSLFTASFLRANIIYNDLGVRAVLFLILPVLIWTVRSAQSVPSLGKLRPFAQVLLFVGLMGTTWDLVGMRLIRPPFFPMQPIETNNSPSIAYALRDAYGWADKHLPDGAVLQHNPTITQRSLDFGLYGHHWPAVADREAILFGASRQAVQDRLAQLRPIFNGNTLPEDLVARSASARIDYLLFTSRDPIWRAQGGSPTGLYCLYRSQWLCIAPPKDIRS